jgi:hypothetical protein
VCYCLMRYTNYFSNVRKKIMAMKKKAPAKKAAPKAAGSDRGAKIKANEAEKKIQAKNAAKNAVQTRMEYVKPVRGEEQMSTRVYNSFSNDLARDRKEYRKFDARTRSRRDAVKKETVQKARNAKQKER